MTVADIIKNISFTKHATLADNLYYDGQRFKWKSSFDSLKQFVAETLGIVNGIWSSLGGSAKRFTAEITESGEELYLTWYAKKQHTIILPGRLGLKLQDKLVCLTSESEQYNNKDNQIPIPTEYKTNGATQDQMQSTASAGRIVKDLNQSVSLALVLAIVGYSLLKLKA